MWSAGVVGRILTNPIYTGDLMQGRRLVKSYKVHQIEEVPEEEWVVVPDIHDAIISKADFEKGQGLLKRDIRTAPKGRELHLFSGFLKCTDCGKAVTRINSAPLKKSESARLNDLIAVKERKLAKISRYKQSVYQDWKDGALTRQEYMDMKSDYDRKADESSPPFWIG